MLSSYPSLPLTPSCTVKKSRNKMITRKNFLKNSSLASLSLATSVPALAADPERKKHPNRFIFMTKSNGLRPADLVPTSFSEKDKNIDKQKEVIERDLNKHTLPAWMSKLENHKKDMAIIQGLSAKGMACGHNAHQPTNKRSRCIGPTISSQLCMLACLLPAYNTMWSSPSWVWPKAGRGKDWAGGW